MPGSGISGFNILNAWLVGSVKMATAIRLTDPKNPVPVASDFKRGFIDYFRVFCVFRSANLHQGKPDGGRVDGKQLPGATENATGASAA